MSSLPQRAARHAAALLAAWLLLVGPQAAARELSTDRPDQTESPYTVEPGRYQAEFQIAAVGHGPGGTRPSWQVAAVNLKRGLSRTIDLQFVTPGLEFIPSAEGRDAAVGDLMLRLKWNARGNDTEGFAWGLMPFVSFPTGMDGVTAGGFEGGLIVPAAFPLSERAGLGVMAQGDVVRDGDGSGTHVVGLFTATVSREIRGPLGGFVELAARVRPRAEGARETMLDLGATYGLTADSQLDAGIQWGLSEAAEDSRVFLGLSVRR
jgi:hypothetical protein